MNGADFTEYKNALKNGRDGEPILRKFYPEQPKEELIKMVLPIAEKYSPGIIYKLANLPEHERWGITNKIVLMTKEHEARQAGNGANQNPESETPQPGQGVSSPQPAQGPTQIEQGMSSPQPAQGPPQSEQKTLPPQSVLGALDALIDKPGQSIPLIARSNPDDYAPISNNHPPPDGNSDLPGQEEHNLNNPINSSGLGKTDVERLRNAFVQEVHRMNQAKERYDWPYANNSAGAIN